ncbi:MAG: tetratricopeptide repeat protein [Planctomycetota bacterium]
MITVQLFQSDGCVGSDGFHGQRLFAVREYHQIEVAKRLSKIKNLLLFVAVISGLYLVSHAEEQNMRERNFVRGLEVFDHAKTPEDYGKAAELFETLLENDYQNGAVYYNLGNARLRAGEYGKAIAAYRKAKLYRPRDQYFEMNLKQALHCAPGCLPEQPRPWWKLVLFWSDQLAYSEKFQIALAAFCVGAVLTFIALLCGFRRGYWISAAVVTVALILSIDAALAYIEVNYMSRAVVITETIARKGIGENYEPAFNQPLKDGAEFIIIDRSGDWIFGHFEGAGDGWLRRNCIVEYLPIFQK